MPREKGMIVLMGSGELTSTMVEVHKEVLSRLGPEPKAVFLDTPAGFQLNVDQLSQRAVEYFRKHVQHPMSVVSFRSKDVPAVESGEAFRSLREAGFVLVGPGSPSYAVRQWRDTPVPDILARRIGAGGCLVAASAAALTVGSFTLPVYEIYKVGHDIHWVEGMNILGYFGFNYVVVPHWNNAEGGTHDTRFCFMGEERFDALTSLLPAGTGVIGLDEHTACILDLETGEAEVRGIGRVTVRHGGSEQIFGRGDRFPLDVLRKGGEDGSGNAVLKAGVTETAAPEKEEKAFWDTVHDIEDTFSRALDGGDAGDAAGAVLELDRIIWKALHDLENEEFISQAREILREFIVLLGTKNIRSQAGGEGSLETLVRELLALRTDFRKNRQWKEADAIRDCLTRSGITVEDSPEGSSWRLNA